jgi:hypothetical protein
MRLLARAGPSAGMVLEKPSCWCGLEDNVC